MDEIFVLISTTALLTVEIPVFTLDIEESIPINFVFKLLLFKFTSGTFIEPVNVLFPKNRLLSFSFAELELLLMTSNKFVLFNKIVPATFKVPQTSMV